VAKGVSLCRPDAETLAALQALRSLISDARSGDLHDSGEPIGPKDGREWLFQNLDSRLTAFFWSNGGRVGNSGGSRFRDYERHPRCLEDA